MRVRDVMTTTVVTAPQDATFQQLVDLMFRHGVRGIPVVDDDRRPIGIVTKSDLITKEARAGGSCAGDLMTTPVRTVRADDLLSMVAPRMVTTGVDRLPVVGDDGRLVGIVTATDVLRRFHRTDKEVTLDVRTLLDDAIVVPGGETIAAGDAPGVATLKRPARPSSHARVIDTLLRELTGTVDIIDQVHVDGRRISE